MISEVVVPSRGATGGNAIIDTWLIREGEQVIAGAPLFSGFYGQGQCRS